jgi:hypothetical protein
MGADGRPRAAAADLWADHAARLAGLVGVLLGWRPQEFWHATPAELAAVLGVLAGADGDSGDAALLARLKEMYPDER